MTSLLSDSSSVWAALLVVVLPIVVIGSAELQERLRQRDSALMRVVQILRLWTVPLLAAWALLRGMFEFEASSLLVRVVGTGLVLSLAVVALLMVRIVIAQVADRNQERERARIPQLVLALPRIVVLIATGWVLLDTVWGVDLSAAMAALGVTSLIVSFALQDTLSGLASGLLLLSDSPFQPGDWIRAGDLEGKVVDINWRSSRILDRNGDLVVVPNAELAGGTVINFDSPSRLHRVVVPVQVAYVNPPTLAKEMLLDAARATDGVLDYPAPNVRVVQIDDPLMGYEVDLWIDDFTIAPKVFSDFGSLVWYSSHRNDVPLPSPAYDLYMYDGVQAGLAGIPDRSEMRRRLQISPLFESLDLDDLDRLAAAGAAVRYAAGERVLSGTDEANRDLYVLWEGTARISVTGEAGAEINLAELAAGDVFGMLRRSDRDLYVPQVVALSDCEMVRIGEEAAGAVASRNPALAAALNQVAATRRRRLERIVEQLDRTSAVSAEPSEAVKPEVERSGERI